MGKFIDIILIFLMLFISLTLRVTDYFPETLFPVVLEISLSGKLSRHFYGKRVLVIFHHRLNF